MCGFAHFAHSRLLTLSSPLQVLLESQVTGNLAAPRGYPCLLGAGELKAGSRREVVWRVMFVGDEHTATLWELELAAKRLSCLFWLTSETSGFS